MDREEKAGDPIVGALQPAYLPWIGFFDQVYHTDVFILYDDLAYSRKTWRNRNRIKGPHGAQWLTVPVCFRPGQKINEVRIDPGSDWRSRHIRRIEHCYRRAPYFSRYWDDLLALYRREWERLSDLNVALIRSLLGAFGIRTKLLVSSEIGLERDFQASNPPDSVSTRRIVHFLKRLGARRFLEGEAGREYIRDGLLTEAGLEVRYQSYRHRPYPQRFGGFLPYLSAIDLLFNCGPQSLPVLVNPSPFEAGPVPADHQEGADPGGVPGAGAGTAARKP